MFLMPKNVRGVFLNYIDLPPEKKIMLFYLYGIFFANIESPHVQQVLV